MENSDCKRDREEMKKMPRHTKTATGHMPRLEGRERCSAGARAQPCPIDVMHGAGWGHAASWEKRASLCALFKHGRHAMPVVATDETRWG